MEKEEKEKRITRFLVVLLVIACFAELILLVTLF